jgi:hypothetical protein
MVRAKNLSARCSAANGHPRPCVTDDGQNTPATEALRGGCFRVVLFCEKFCSISTLNPPLVKPAALYSCNRFSGATLEVFRKWQVPFLPGTGLFQPHPHPLSLLFNHDSELVNHWLMICTRPPLRRLRQAVPLYYDLKELSASF